MTGNLPISFLGKTKLCKVFPISFLSKTRLCKILPICFLGKTDSVFTKKERGRGRSYNVSR